MNSNITQNDLIKNSKYEKSYKILKKIEDKRFGTIFLLINSKTRNYLIQKEHITNDRKELIKMISIIKSNIILKTDYIMKVLDFSVKEESKLCSTFYILKLFYPYPKSDLLKELQNKQLRGENYSGEELTIFLYNIIQGISDLNFKGIYFEDLRPSNITYNYQSKKWEIIKVDFFGDLTLNRIKAKQMNNIFENKTLYMSPKMFQNLKNNNINFRFNLKKEISFILGLCVLETGNMESIQNIYNQETKKINIFALDKHLQNFNFKYNKNFPLLTSTINSFLVYDEEKRFSYEEIKGEMPTLNNINTFLKNKKNHNHNLKYNKPLKNNKSIINVCISNRNFYIKNNGRNLLMSEIKKNHFIKNNDNFFNNTRTDIKSTKSFMNFSKNKQMINFFDNSLFDNSNTKKVNNDSIIIKSSNDLLNKYNSRRNILKTNYKAYSINQKNNYIN